jgi:hypothetical protein
MHCLSGSVGAGSGPGEGEEGRPAAEARWPQTGAGRRAVLAEITYRRRDLRDGRHHQAHPLCLSQAGEERGHRIGPETVQHRLGRDPAAGWAGAIG